MRISDWSSDVCSSDLLQAQLAPVDAGAVGDHPRDGAEAGGDARRGGVGIGGQAVPEHRRVELVGLAVGIDEGARKEGMQQRRAHLRRADEDLMHEAVFGTPEADRIEAGRSQEHTSELPSLMRLSYAVFCLKKTK